MTATEAPALTARQAVVLRFLWAGLLRDGIQPSYREIMDHCAIRSPNAIRHQFRRLAGAGYIAQGSYRCRSLSLVRLPDGRPFLGLKPVVDPAVPAVGPPALTGMQGYFYSWVFAEVLRNGFQPTLREAMARFRWKSLNGPQCHIKALARKGFLGRADGESRSLRLLRTPNGERIAGFAAIEEGEQPWA
jgi:SOS-response transcriptional repressor LexA